MSRLQDALRQEEMQMREECVHNRQSDLDLATFQKGSAPDLPSQHEERCCDDEPLVGRNALQGE